MKSSNTLMIITAVIALAGGLWLGNTDFNQDSTTLKPSVIQGAIYPKAKVINNFKLQSHLSEEFTKNDFLKHWSLIFVGYTHCPDVCPTTMAVMNQVVEFMQQQQLVAPQIIFLSIDPERDSAAILKPYVSYFNSDFIGLTGSLDEVKKFSRELNAVFRKSAGASGDISNDDYLMDHSSALMLINPQGNLQAILTAPHTPANIIESIINTQAYYAATSN